MVGVTTYDSTAKKKKANTLVENTAQKLIDSKSAGTKVTASAQPTSAGVGATGNIGGSVNSIYDQQKKAQNASNAVTNSGKYTVTNNPIDPSKTYTLDNSFNGILIGDADNGYKQPTAPAAEDPYKGGGNGGGNGGGYSYYDPSADLMAAYNARQEAQRQNYEAALEQLRRAYDTTVGDIKNQSDAALRQAYINMMMNRRGLNQSLEAQGLRGGASESALAGIFNNYANNRNSIAQAVAQNLASAGNKYGENIANLGMQYNTNTADAMANYQTQLANARQSLASALAKTTSNYRGTGQDASAVADATSGTNATTNPNLLIDIASGSLLPLSNPNGNSTGAAWNDVSEQNRQYRIRNYTPAYIRNNNMSALDAANYVKNLDIDDEVKLAILLDAGFSKEELNAIANYF